uniref:Sulfatase domain-containing protein n=1 Tax=Panagrellus redivivus TaxID=6233 RepID=A0A7E4ZY05_PANRE
VIALEPLPGDDIEIDSIAINHDFTRAALIGRRNVYAFVIPNPQDQTVCSPLDFFPVSAPLSKPLGFLPLCNQKFADVISALYSDNILRVYDVKYPQKEVSCSFREAIIASAKEDFDETENQSFTNATSLGLSKAIISYTPFHNCSQTVEMSTKLENGKLYLLDQRDNIQCWWQCLTTESDYQLIRGPWKKLANGDVPECDVIETTCRENQAYDASTLTPDDDSFKNTSYYNFLHAQVYRKDTPKNLKKTPPPNLPDVHIFLIDSVSNSHSIRGIPKTRHYLREHFDAVSFPYLNKIGLNSRPNGFAFLMGKTVFDIRKSPISVGYSHDCPKDSSCCKLLENHDFISFLYQDAGYKTMISEDYKHTIFASGPCLGFNSTPVDHYMRPYQLRVDHENYTTPLLQNSVYDGLCRDSFVPQFEYLKDFLEKYPDKPKFTISWLTKLSHDDHNTLFHADDYFYNFFRNNSEKLNNSYMFVMADHGT